MSSVDLTDVQGDIILGLPKRVESFIFFQIAQVDKFRRVLGDGEFLKLIKSTAEIKAFRNKIQEHKMQSQGKPASLLPFAAVNIAFTQPGLNLLGLTENIADDQFKAGQLARAQQLGDSGVTAGGKFDPAWLKEFKTEIHGLILIAADCDTSLPDTELTVLSLLGSSITQVLKVCGNVRPGTEKGREHFGYMDGISLPAVKGIVSPLPGQFVVDPGVILLGQDGDPRKAQRPSWAKNGSFLVYRHLDQLVPEFDLFKRKNALRVTEIGVEKGAELLGSRLFGRWKDGTPIAISPVTNDPALAADPLRNNKFDFSQPTDQSFCPFAAHIRKTNPRSDLPAPAVAQHAINRHGIPFGPEVTISERSYRKTQYERGLAFVCYQSTLDSGFEFMQMSWANNVGFIFGKVVDGKPFNPGFDPIIGQNNGNARQMGGYDPSAQGNNINLPTEFVISKGGAYLFSPSISVLKTKIGIPSH